MGVQFTEEQKELFDKTVKQAADAAAEKARAENLPPAEVAELKAAAAEVAELKAEVKRGMAVMAEMKASRSMFGDAGENGVGGAWPHGAGKSIVSLSEAAPGLEGSAAGKGIVYHRLGAETREFAREMVARAKEVGRGQSISLLHFDPLEKVVTIGDDETAGVLDMPEFVAGIWERVFLDDWLLGAVQTLPMARDFISATQLQQLFGDDPDYDGNIGDRPVSEKPGTTEDANPKFRAVDFKAKKLRSLQKMSRDFVSDVPFFMSWLSNRLRIKLRRTMVDQIVRGDGALEMLGFLTGGAESVPRATALQFRRVDAVALDAAIDEAHGENLTYLARKATTSDYALDLTVDTTWDDMRGPLSRQRAILGYPVQMSKHPSKLGTRGDAILGDWTAYILALRMDVEILVTNERFWDEECIGMMARTRGDGQTIFTKAIAALSDAS